MSGIRARFECARQQMEDGEKNGSEDDDDEKPGKRVMGPRKKFIWDDKLRFESFSVTSLMGLDLLAVMFGS